MALTYLAVVVFDSRYFIFGFNVIADVASLQDDGTGGSTTSYGDDGEKQPGERFGDTYAPPLRRVAPSRDTLVLPVAGLSSLIFCALVPVGATVLLRRTSGSDGGARFLWFSSYTRGTIRHVQAHLIRFLSTNVWYGDLLLDSRLSRLNLTKRSAPLARPLLRHNARAVFIVWFRYTQASCSILVAPPAKKLPGLVAVCAVLLRSTFRAHTRWNRNRTAL